MRTQLPIPNNFEGTAVAPRLQRFCFNMFNDGSRLISRPSFSLNTSRSGGEARGIFTARVGGGIYSVHGDTLHGADNSPFTVDIGNQDVATAADFNGIAIATGDKNYWIDGTTNIVSELTYPDFTLPACSDVDYINGYFVWTPADGGVLRYSEINDAGNVSSLSFFDAESLPDINLATVVIRNELFVFGQDSIERFRVTTDVNAPFRRVENAISSIGYVGGLVEATDSFIFVGRPKTGGRRIYQFNGGALAEISTPAINELINKADTLILSAARFEFRGLDVYYFNFTRFSLYMTIGANGVNWGFLSAYDVGSAFHDDDIGNLSWPKFDLKGAIYNDPQNTWYMQRDDGIYLMGFFNEDSSQSPIDRGFKTYIRAPDDPVFTLNGLELSVSTESDVSDPPQGGDTIALRVSPDGKNWSSESARDYGSLDTKGRLQWTMAGGLGRYEGYAGIYFMASDLTPLTIENLVAL